LIALPARPQQRAVTAIKPGGETKMTDIMHRYSNPRMEATIDNWPHGSKRVTAKFHIEIDTKRGQRAVRITTGAPKKLTFAKQMRIVDGADGRTYIAALTEYGHITIWRGDMKYHEETFFERDYHFTALRDLLFGV
jgi:hypothetical protein